MYLTLGAGRAITEFTPRSKLESDAAVFIRRSCLRLEEDPAIGAHVEDQADIGSEPDDDVASVPADGIDRVPLDPGFA